MLASPAALAEAVRVSLAQGVARQSGIGLSQGSLEDAYNLILRRHANALMVPLLG